MTDPAPPPGEPQEPAGQQPPPQYPPPLPPPPYAAPAYPLTGAGHPVYMAIRTSSRAIAVLVLGIVGLGGLCAYGITFIAAIVALALAPGARREIRDSNGYVTGSGLVTAGVICSWITLGIVALGLIIAIIALAASA